MRNYLAAALTVLLLLLLGSCVGIFASWAVMMVAHG